MTRVKFEKQNSNKHYAFIRCFFFIRAVHKMLPRVFLDSRNWNR